jgi:tetratricopeptide (TPR) repeat protein/O-antigen ligase
LSTAALATTASYLRILEIGALFSLVVFPPLASGATALWAYNITVWIAFLGLSALVMRRLIEGRSILPATGILIPFAILAAMAVSSVFVSIYPSATWKALLRFMMYLAVFFLATETAGHRGRTYKLLMVMTGVAAFLVIVGLVKYSGGSVPTFWQHNVPGQEGFLTSTFYNHNHIAGFLEIVFPIALSLVFIWDPPRRHFWFAAVVLLIVGLVLAMSRGAWVATFVSMGCCTFLLWLKRRWGWRRMIPIGLALTVLILLVFLASTPALERLGSMDNPNEPSISTRTDIWEGTVQLVKERPLLGWGLGTFPWSFPHTRPLGMFGRAREAHCDYLQIVAALGLGVLVPLVWAAFVTFRRGIRTFFNTRSSFKEAVSLGSMGAVVALLVHSVFDFNIQITSNGILFFSVVGLAVGLKRQGHVRKAVLDNHQDQEDELTDLTPPSDKEIQKRKRLAALVGSAMILVIAFAGYILGWGAAADIKAVRGKQMMAQGAPGKAYPLFKEAIEFNPDNVEYYYLLAGSAMDISRKLANRDEILHNMTAADWACRAALDLNPLEGNLWYRLAQIRWWAEALKGVSQPDPEVGRFLENALKLDPANGKYLLGIVRYHLARNEVDKSLPFLKDLVIANPEAYQDLKSYPGWQAKLSEPYRQELLAALENKQGWKGEIRKALIRLAVQRNDWKEAAKYQGQIVDHLADRAGNDSFFDLGVYLLNSGMHQPAKEAFFQALKRVSDKTRGLSLAKWHIGKTNHPEMYADIVSHLAKTDASLRYKEGLLLGEIYLKQKRWKDAEAQFLKAQEIKETAEVHEKLALAYFGLKNWDAAELESAKALLRNPKNPWYHYLLARALKEQDKFQAALAAVETAISLSSTWTHYYFSLRAMILVKLRMYKEAINSYELAFAAAPQNYGYLVSIGDAYAKLKQIDKAREAYLKALKLSKDKASIQKKLDALAATN